MRLTVFGVEVTVRRHKTLQRQRDEAALAVAQDQRQLLAAIRRSTGPPPKSS